MDERQAVPGMAELLRVLTGGAPHVPVVYLSGTFLRDIWKGGR